MKIRKNISKLLGLSLFITNFSLYPSMATSNNEIPNRYETLEGEYITIDNSTEGELYEIEIFGNTIQDENNLEDIQSVGDLYVDENGNPILDKQGRKQYKIDIVTKGKNLFDIDRYYEDNKHIRGVDRNNDSLIFSCDNNTNIGSQILSNKKYTINHIFKPNTSYIISYDVVNTGDFLARIIVEYVDGSKLTPTYNHGKSIIVTDSNKTIKNIGFAWETQLSGGTTIWSNIQIEEGNTITEYAQYKESKTNILLPTQLQKVGDIADRLYWDNSKGKYVVEKKVNSFIIDGTEPVRIAETTNNGYIVAQFTKNLSNFITGNNLDSVNNMAIKNTSGDNIYTGIYDGIREAFYIKDDFVRIKILKSRLTEEGLTEDLEGISKYFNKHNFISYMITNIKIIETNITYKLIIPTYDNKTNIFSQTENGVNPTIKITIDRLNKMALDATTEAENNPTIDNLNTARNIVNQMDEGELKEQLQQRLNQISNLNDLQLERKTSTSNVDIYIKSENMLSMALSTNTITFENYSGVDDLEQSNAIKISINSSLPYQLNSYLVSEMQNADGAKIIDKDRLNIKDSSDIDYKKFITINDKLVLKDNCNAGNDLSHYIDLKLSGGEAYTADIYKTVIKFEAEQK